MCHCERCKRDVDPVRGSRAWWAALIAGWVLFFAFAPFLAIMSPFNLVVMPCLLFGMINFVGYASDRANPPPRCPTCEADLTHAPKVARPRAATAVPVTA
jgi:hypothetical protein